MEYVYRLVTYSILLWLCRQQLLAIHWWFWSGHENTCKNIYPLPYPMRQNTWKNDLTKNKIPMIEFLLLPLKVQFVRQFIIDSVSKLVK